MRLAYVGTIGEVLRGGGGKLSPTNGDPGDIRKPPGQEQFMPTGVHPESNNPSHHPYPGG